MKKVSISEIAIVGIFSAMAFAGGYLLIAVHNVEIFTATIFLSGILFGKRTGALVGAIASALFAVFNPYGISPLPLFIVQVLSRALMGYSGGVIAPLALANQTFWLKSVVYGLTGLILTWIYIILTLLSEMVTVGFSLEQLRVSFAFGIVSYTILTVNNLLIFMFVLPFVIKNLKKNALISDFRLKV